MTTPMCPSSFDEFPGLRHADEVLAAHTGRPSPQEMAPKKPAVDRGIPDDRKYGGANGGGI